MIGAALGAPLGAAVGDAVGAAVGARLGAAPGIPVGTADGAASVRVVHWAHFLLPGHCSPPSHPHRFLRLVPLVLQSNFFTLHFLSWPWWPLHLPFTAVQSPWPEQSCRVRKGGGTETDE